VAQFEELDRVDFANVHQESAGEILSERVLGSNQLLDSSMP